jgi:hypothetical protein
MSKQKLLSNKKGIGFDDFVPLLILGFSSVIIIAVIMVSSVILEAKKDTAVNTFIFENRARTDFIDFLSSTIEVDGETMAIKDFLSRVHSENMHLFKEKADAFLKQGRTSFNLYHGFIWLYDDKKELSETEVQPEDSGTIFFQDPCSSITFDKMEASFPSHHYGTIKIKFCYETTASRQKT